MTGRRRPEWALAFVAWALCLVPAVVAAQAAVAPRQVFRGAVEFDTPWLALLRAAAAGGSQERLEDVAGEFLDDLAREPAIAPALERAGLTGCCDRHVVQIAFLASEAADAPLVRVFLYQKGLVRNLPGLYGPEHPVVEVFVAEDLSVTLDTVYESTPLESPLAEQTGDFVRLVLGKFELPSAADRIVTRVARVLADPTRGAETAGLREMPPPLAVTLARVDLPARRAKLRISHTVSMTDPGALLGAQARWLADAIMREALIAAALDGDNTNAARQEPGTNPPYIATSACAATASALAETITDTLAASECAPLGLDPAPCFKRVAGAVNQDHETEARAGNICPGAWPVARRFLAIVPARVRTSAGTVTVTNTPKEKWSFGLSTAYIALLDIERARPRTRISSGRIVVDPFSRLLAMGTVSFVPAGYVPGGVGMTMAERFRVFGGVAFAPHFGGTAGVSWSFNRYLGVNAGYALLAYDTPKPGETIDEPPTEANRAAPFSLASTHALFVGLTYNIK